MQYMSCSVQKEARGLSLSLSVDNYKTLSEKAGLSKRKK